MPILTAHSTLTSSVTTFPQKSISAPHIDSRRRLGHLIARILQMILPKDMFCWLSRISIQVQSAIHPKRWPYWTQLSDHIIVGAIPIKNMGHLEKITQLGVGAVLSINKKHEFKDLPFSNPVQPKDWRERKIEFLRISSEDLAPLELSTLSLAVAYVIEQVKLGKKVYIHCTGGRGRSVSVAIACLVKTQFLTLTQAYNHVIQHRRQVVLSQKQIESVACILEKTFLYTV